MYATYGATVRGLLAQGVTPGEVAHMALHLPLDAPVWREIDPSLAWTPTQHALITLVDEMRYLTWVTIKLARPKYREKPPKPTPRPGHAKAKPKPWLAPTETFDSPGDFDAWRESRLSSQRR